MKKKYDLTFGKRDGKKIQHKFGVLTEDLMMLRDLMLSEGFKN